MRVVILAAGKSMRFREEGYMVPKPFLEVEWRGTTKTMLEHVIETVPLELYRISIAITPEYHKKMIEIWETHLERKMLPYIVDSTKGPADTLLQVLQSVQTESTLILDTDLLNHTNDLSRITHSGTCSVLVSKSTHPSYSYVDGLGLFTRIVEKQRISQYAVQGAYFVPIQMMENFIAQLEGVIQFEKEPYVSHAINRLAGQKRAYLTSYTPIDWGTPENVRLSGAHIITEKGEKHASDNSGERPASSTPSGGTPA